MEMESISVPNFKAEKLAPGGEDACQSPRVTMLVTEQIVKVPSLWLQTACNFCFSAPAP